jgi:hypothetical protein
MDCIDSEIPFELDLLDFESSSSSSRFSNVGGLSRLVASLDIFFTGGSVLINNLIS